MKKTLLLTALAAMLGSTSVNAQILKSYGGMAVIPGTQTNSGKSMLITADYLNTRAKGPLKESDYDDDFDDYMFTVYDTNMREQTKFSITVPQIPYNYWTERAVTNVKVDDLIKEMDRYAYEYAYPAYNDVTITTAEDLADYLGSYNGGKYKPFVDRQGKQSVIEDYEGNYWNYYEFGKVAPRNYYYVENNIIYRCEVYYDFDYALIESCYNNWSSLNWQKYGETQTTSMSCSLAEHTVYDFERVDGTFDMEDPIPLSQNIFNNDDKWEFVFVANMYSNVFESGSGYKFNEDGYLYFERIQTEMTGDSFDFMVVNQDGTVLNKINLEDELCDDDEFDVYRMGGKTYLKFRLHDKEGEHYEALYEYSSMGDGVKLVSKTRLKVAPSIVNRGESVKVDLGDKTSKLMVSNSAGQLLMQQNAHGNTSIDTHRLAKGVYNITVEEQGKPRKTERFIVK